MEEMASQDVWGTDKGPLNFVIGLTWWSGIKYVKLFSYELRNRIEIALVHDRQHTTDITTPL